MTCGVMQAIKQSACLIACVTPQVINTSFWLVTSNQHSPKSGDFVTSKFYGKVPRHFSATTKKTEKSGLAMRDYSQAGTDRSQRQNRHKLILQYIPYSGLFSKRIYFRIFRLASSLRK